jgi:alkanesulfonate monooxygenase SsuD/methylene tetrahydromethanopterin reductase-like flavin-dependent oxidoreductase (luciferase family)
MAAHSERVELQLLDGGVAFRHPGVLARTVATLDVLSGGRARLCLGPGWYEREHRAVGVPFPPLRDRFELLEQALQVVRRAWSDDALSSPRPLRRVPVMVSGVGERKALRLVARYADACHLFAGGDSDSSFVAGKLAVLREHCDAEGRDHASLSRTILWTDPVDPSRPRPFLDRMGEMAEVGVDEVHVQLGDRAVDLVRALGEHVVPGVHRL